MKNKEYSESIERIWKKYQPLNIELAELQPLCYTDVPRSGLLIIGLNPSFSPQADKTPFLGKCHPEQSSNIIMQAKNDKIGYHTALKKFVGETDNFSNDKEFVWGHIDLFFFRKKDSGFVKEQRKIKEHEGFYNEQMDLTKEMTLSRTPKVILVNNAYASYLIFRHWMNEDEDLFDDTIGTYRFNGIPIFFSGMLSGQRALDIHNRKRLAWQISNFLKK